MKTVTAQAQIILALLVLAFCAQGHWGSALTPDSARGYVNVVVDYGARNDGTEAEATTQAIQKAIDFARENRKVVFFPSGTYLINDKIRCHAWTTYKDPDQLTNALVGSTVGARPVIKLAPKANGFNDAKSPKAMLEFKNIHKEKPTTERAPANYYQMLRGIDLDCGGNAGAYGAYFSAAQNASIEDVKVNATGAYAGFKGLPGRAWGVVNIEVVGGQYGIDTVGTSPAGCIVAGAVFKNQTVSAIRYASFAPLNVVGFEIETPAGSTQSALATVSGGPISSHGVNLIDGKIICGGPSKIAAIDNSAGRNLYVRNVFVSGADQIVKSGTQPAVTVSEGDWTRIEEYSYCDQKSEKLGKYKRMSRNLIDGKVTETPEPATVVRASSAPPEDLVLRHRWVRLPSLEDADCVDAADYGIAPGKVSSTAFQKVIDSHQKIFMRPGLYKLDGTITLGSKTILFGTARHLTQITHDPAWKVTKETPVITTVDDPEATTYLGDLIMGYNVAKADLANSWFTMLDWKAGRNSMVHTGEPFAIPASGGELKTQAHSMLKVSGSGGGRWYFTGCHESNGFQHPEFRIFETENTTQPLWIYGLNAEHPVCDRYTEFSGSNIRIYGVKSEDRLDGMVVNPIVTFNNAKNVAMFGHGALRNNPGANQGSIEVNGASDRVVIAQVLPQLSHKGADGFTVLDNTGTPAGVKYPDCVSLFKRGVITAEDEAIMTHDAIDYGAQSVAAK